MTNANDRQVGGSHYKITYQPWDFFCDIDLHFLPANALKYISRWREKDGIKDLNKAIHYLEKAIERGIKLPLFPGGNVDKWLDQYEDSDGLIMAIILCGVYKAAITQLQTMIRSEQGPTSYDRYFTWVDTTKEGQPDNDNSNT